MREVVISEAFAGGRLDKTIGLILPGLGRGLLYKMLRKKNILLNGKKAAGSELLSKGDVLRFYFSEETFLAFSENRTAENRTGAFSDQSGFAELKRGAVSEGASSPEGASPPERVSASKGASPPERRFAPVRKSMPEGKPIMEEASLLPPRDFPSIPVLFENEHVLIFDKPAGVLAQKGEREDYSLSEYLKFFLLQKGELYPNAAPAHRLDRNTSGITACAKTPAGSRSLSGLFRERRVKKEYLAFVKGDAGALFAAHSGKRERLPGKTRGHSEAEENALALSGYLSKEEKRNLSRFSERPFPGSVPVAIRVRPAEISAGKELFLFDGAQRISLLSVELLTGKSHQIRAQLSALGFPLLGDPKYGDPALNKGLTRFGIRRQLLHAFRLSFPADAGSGLAGKVIEAPLPEDFLRVIRNW